MWLVSGFSKVQVSSFTLEKHSTSTSLLINPSFSNTTPQKSGIALGGVLSGFPRQGNPSGR